MSRIDFMVSIFLGISLSPHTGIPSARQDGPPVVTQMTSGGPGSFERVCESGFHLATPSSDLGSDPVPGEISGSPPLPGSAAGRSWIAMDVFANEGGLFCFNYRFRTQDRNARDWLDIWLETPDGRLDVVRHLDRPADSHDESWESAPVPVSINLTPWKYQRVRVVVALAAGSPTGSSVDIGDVGSGDESWSKTSEVARNQLEQRRLVWERWRALRHLLPSPADEGVRATFGLRPDRRPTTQNER